jgi:hypothetical protein
MYALLRKRLLPVIMAALLLLTTACGRVVPAAEGDTGDAGADKPAAVTDKEAGANGETAPQKTDSNRMNALLAAFEAKGLRVGEVEVPDSSVIGSLYGCLAQYNVMLDDHLIIFMEFDMNNLDSTAEKLINSVREDGEYWKTDEPAWHHGEFVMMGAASQLESGEVVAEFKTEEHPKFDTLLDVFINFK